MTHTSAEFYMLIHDLMRWTGRPLRVEKSVNSDCVSCGFAVRFRARAVCAPNKRVRVKSFVLPQIFVTARFFHGGKIICYFGIVATSLLCLDREALPLTISFADCVLIRKPASARLDRALCFLGILSSVFLS